MFGFQLPKDFLIGTANSAFQSEGAWDRDGKSPSIMDTFAEEYAGKYPPGRAPKGNLNGRDLANSEDLPDRGCFFYDHYEEYIDDMVKTGQNTYRFSLAWPRILPDGVGKVNQLAIDFYNKIINKLLENNITPFVDLYHWDLPHCLHEQGGFTSEQFPEWFEAYAKVCFDAFGDRVKMWSTFNEPQVFIGGGLQGGNFPPFEMDRKNAKLASLRCIIAHFRAVRLYKSMDLGGKIGAVQCFSPVAPVHLTQEDLGAVERSIENQLGWWVQPMLEGTYPQILLRECPVIAEAMPENFQQELDKWFIPMDFIGVNYYTANRTEYDPTKVLKAKGVRNFFSEPGQQFVPYPPGLMDVVQYICDRYHNIDLYITENGCALKNINDKEKECDDPARVTYIREHLRMVARCIRAGYNVKGYYYWNDADSYEELDGYRLRFGLTWVDHETGERCWKKSRHYFSEVCKTHMVD